MTLPFKRSAVGKQARKREERLAKAEGGRRVAGSGSKREKGDVVIGKFRIEDKQTDAMSFRLSVNTWLKIEREALHTPPGLLPQMRVTLGTGRSRRTLRIISEDDFNSLMEEK